MPADACRLAAHASVVRHPGRRPPLLRHPPHRHRSARPSPPTAAAATAIDRRPPRQPDGAQPAVHHLPAAARPSAARLHLQCVRGQAEVGALGALRGRQSADGVDAATGPGRAVVAVRAAVSAAPVPDRVVDRVAAQRPGVEHRSGGDDGCQCNRSGHVRRERAGRSCRSAHQPGHAGGCHAASRAYAAAAAVQVPRPQPRGGARLLRQHVSGARMRRCRAARLHRCPTQH